MSPNATHTNRRPVLAQDHALQQAGLQHSVHQAEDFQLALLTGVTLLRLHTLQPVEQLASGLKAGGIVLPEKVNAATGQDPCVLCLAPSEWLVFSEYLSCDPLRPLLQAAVDPEQTALLDQTAAMAVFRLGGPAAPWLLRKCGGVDWQTTIASGQHCCRTLLDRVPAIVHYHQPGNGAGPHVFDVMLDRSLARHGWQMFLQKLPHARELLLQHGPLQPAAGNARTDLNP